MHKRIGPQVTILQSLGELEGSQGVIWAITEVCVPLAVNELEDVVPVVILVGRPKLLHPAEKGKHGISKTPTNQRFPIHPREEVPCG